VLGLVSNLDVAASNGCPEIQSIARLVDVPSGTQTGYGSARRIDLSLNMPGRGLDFEVQLKELHRRELGPRRKIWREVAVGERLAVVARIP
jgi:hypothetical protein